MKEGRRPDGRSCLCGSSQDGGAVGGVSQYVMSLRYLGGSGQVTVGREGVVVWWCTEVVMVVVAAQ